MGWFDLFKKKEPRKVSFKELKGWVDEELKSKEVDEKVKAFSEEIEKQKKILRHP